VKKPERCFSSQTDPSGARQVRPTLNGDALVVNYGKHYGKHYWKHPFHQWWRWKTNFTEREVFELTKAGSVGRNTARGDGFIDLDLAVSRKFQLSERHSLDFRAEVFNVVNRANFGLPVRIIGAPGFGSAVETAAPARVMQFALKYGF
jgi:hypothetical protein